LDITLDKICGIINSNKTFSIYAHINTDIDAVGSTLALKRALEKKGKIAHVFIDSTFPSNTNMFTDVAKINNEKQKEYDICFVLDCADENRLGRLKYKYRKNVKNVVCIDHHLNNGFNLKNKYVDNNVSSTCEIIFNLIKKLGFEFDAEICKLLISGMYTDTGALKFSNTYPSSFRAAAELLEKSGLYMDQISMPLFNSLSIESYNLRKLAYNRLKLYENDMVAIITLLADDFDELKVAFDETKGITDIGMQLNSVKIVVLITEDNRERGVYHMSFRTKDNYDARAIAEEFGGGGHLKASGCKVADSLDHTLELVLKAVKKEIDKKC